MIFDKNLYFRRQFILGPRFVDRFHDWRKEKLSDTLYLTIHPDLEFSIAKDGNLRVVLLGFVFDPFKINYTNQDILNEIIQNFQTFTVQF